GGGARSSGDDSSARAIALPIPITTYKRGSRRSGYGAFGKALQVPERVDGRAVDPHLEVQVRAEAVPGAADVPDHVALVHVLAAGDGDRALGAICGREVAAVVDHRQVAVTRLPAAVDDRAARRGVNRRPIAHADVDSLVHPAPAPPERARDRPAHGPDEPGRRRRRVAGGPCLAP